MFVGSAEAMEVGEVEAAPRGAQDCEPRDAVHRMDQGADDGLEVENFLALAEAFEFDGAEGDLLAAQGGGDGGEMDPGAAEDGDGEVFCGVAGFVDPVQMALDDG